MTTQQIDAQVNYTAICASCGGTAGVVSNLCSPEEMSGWVANCIRSGLIVERMTTADMRSRAWCYCGDDCDEPTEGP